MKMVSRVLSCCAVMVWLSGCASNEGDRVFLDSAPIAGKAQRPVLFPDYLLMEGVELHDHGRIPRTQLIGAGMSIEEDVSAVRSRFSDLLYSHGWISETTEIGRQSFRIIAAHQGETVEIRGVQGSTGPTQIFMLYTP